MNAMAPGFFDAEEILQQAQDADSRGDHDSAVRLCRRAAEMSNMDAMCDLAWLHEARDNRPQAISWFKRAVNSGRVSAMVELGRTADENLAQVPMDETRTPSHSRVRSTNDEEPILIFSAAMAKNFVK